MFRGWYNISLTVVGGLVRLTVVDSASRVVQYIPDFVSGLVRLTVVDSASRVVQYIPDCIGGLARLTVVDSASRVVRGVGRGRDSTSSGWTIQRSSR